MGYGSANIDMKTDIMYELVEEQSGADFPTSTDMLDLPKFLEGISFPDGQHEKNTPKRSIPTDEVVVGHCEEALAAVVSDMEDLSHCSSDDELRSTASLHESEVRNKRRKLASYSANVHEEFLNNQIQIAYYNLQQSMKRSEASRRQLVQYASRNDALKKGDYFTSTPSSAGSAAASKSAKMSPKAKTTRSKAKNATSPRSKARRATVSTRAKKAIPAPTPTKPEPVPSFSAKSAPTTPQETAPAPIAPSSLQVSVQ